MSASDTSFKEATYLEQHFADLDSPEATLENKTFEGCTFTRCNLEKASFSKSQFIDCTFQSCNLSLIEVGNTQFTDVSFIDTKLLGVKWPDARDTLFAVHFTDCVLNYCNFFGVNLKKGTVKDCTAHEVSLQEADLTQADCSGTDFHKSIFLNTCLEKTDFSGAQNYEIDCFSNKISKAIFTLPEAVSLLSSLDIKIK
tara:strand:- start:2570 stop:3163 length:594 start_codon:yes stop_codon:yes gene_type:complete